MRPRTRAEIGRRTACRSERHAARVGAMVRESSAPFGMIPIVRLQRNRASAWRECGTCRLTARMRRCLIHCRIFNSHRTGEEKMFQRVFVTALMAAGGWSAFGQVEPNVSLDPSAPPGIVVADIFVD